jgi:membrane protein DedA with SNARE-associated domain
MFAYVLFFLAGVGFGYAVLGAAAWVPLLFPIALALVAMLRDGISGDIVLKLVIALVLTVFGVVAGRVLAAREARQAAPG